MKIEDPKELARELYLSVYTRRPSDRETDGIVRALSEHPQAKPVAIGEIVWAMLTSVEFRFKH